jgi:hypothetical protein
MRSHYSTCIKPPPNPSNRGKSRSEMRKRRQIMDQTNAEKRNQPIHPRVTGKGGSKTTVKYWLVFPKLRLTSTKQIRYLAATIDIVAIIC